MTRRELNDQKKPEKVYRCVVFPNTKRFIFKRSFTLELSLADRIERKGEREKMLGDI